MVLDLGYHYYRCLDGRDRSHWPFLFISKMPMWLFMWNRDEVTWSELYSFDIASLRFLLIIGNVPRYIVFFEPGNNDPDENLCIELTGRSIQRHILCRPKWFQVISGPGWMFALPWESRISFLIRTNLARVWPSFINSYCPFRNKPLLIITHFCEFIVASKGLK